MRYIGKEIDLCLRGRLRFCRYGLDPFFLFGYLLVLLLQPPVDLPVLAQRVKGQQAQDDHQHQGGHQEAQQGALVIVLSYLFAQFGFLLLDVFLLAAYLGCLQLHHPYIG